MSNPPKNPQNQLLESRQQLEFAEKLRLGGRFGDARQVCEQLVSRFPAYSAAFHTLGLACADQQDYNSALINLVKASMLNPSEPRLLTALAGVYLRLGANEMAKRTLQEAQGRSGDDISILVTLGELYREEREYVLAADAFAKVNMLDPDFAPAYLGLGQSLIHLGELEAAGKAFEKLLDAGDRTIGTLFSMSQVPPELRRVDPLPYMKSATPDPGQSARDFAVLKVFSEASMLDQAGDFKQAWAVLQRANEMVELPPMADMLKTISFRMALLDNVRAHPVLQEQPKTGSTEDTQTLFILGPSRAGKTVLERLVAEGEGVKRGFENPSVENAVKHAFLSDAFPPKDNILELPPPLDAAFERAYQADINQRANGAKLFTNTHPGLAQSTLRLAMAVPNARFVFVKRNVEDIALRIYQKKYRDGNFHSYNLASIHEYISWYYELIDLLVERLPDRARIVQYENMVEHPLEALTTVSEICLLDLPEKLDMRVGDDRNCAAPYQAYIAQ